MRPPLVAYRLRLAGGRRIQQLVNRSHIDNSDNSQCPRMPLKHQPDTPRVTVCYATHYPLTVRRHYAPGGVCAATTDPLRSQDSAAAAVQFPYGIKLSFCNIHLLDPFWFRLQNLSPKKPALGGLGGCFVADGLRSAGNRASGFCLGAVSRKPDNGPVCFTAQFAGFTGDPVAADCRTNHNGPSGWRGGVG